MKNNFFVKNSLYVTSALGIIVLAITLVFWDQMPMTQRLIGIYYFLIAAHEWEEMKIPGGFVEMVISLTGMPVKDMIIPKFCLFCLTVYMMLIPFCIPSAHWLLIAPLVLGIIEPLVHLLVGRVNPKGRTSPNIYACVYTSIHLCIHLTTHPYLSIYLPIHIYLSTDLSPECSISLETLPWSKTVPLIGSPISFSTFPPLPNKYLAQESSSQGLLLRILTLRTFFGFLKVSHRVTNLF